MNSKKIATYSILFVLVSIITATLLQPFIVHYHDKKLQAHSNKYKRILEEKTEYLRLSNVKRQSENTKASELEKVLYSSGPSAMFFLTYDPKQYIPFSCLCNQEDLKNFHYETAVSEIKNVTTSKVRCRSQSTIGDKDVTSYCEVIPQYLEMINN